MQPASGKAKPGRKRIACHACSSNKQKCDGATRYPCRRCELYNIQCEYPDGQVPRSAVRVDLGQGTSSAASTPLNGTATAAGGKDDIAAALREMTARLAAIEAGLESDRRSGFRPSAGAASTSSFSLPGVASSSLPHLPAASTSLAVPIETRTSGSSTPAHAESVEMPADSNPLQVLVSTMEQMSRDETAMDEDEGGEIFGARRSENEVGPESDPAYLEQLEREAKNEPRSGRPDAFARGLVTFEDVQTAFAFYVQRIQPWVPVVERRASLVVRDKSPFLFHVILVVTNYYNTSTTVRAREVYAGLNAIIHELLVAHILAPDPSMFTRDFIRGLLLLLYYKPVQTAAYSHRGIKSTSRIVHASKVNALSSLMVHSLIQRAASFIDIQSSPHRLTPVLDNPTGVGPEERKRALAEFRLWCTLIAADALGSLQSGRITWTDPAAALKNARRFAQLAADPTDVRRASVLELYSIVTVPTSETAALHPVRYRLEQLSRINAQLDAWKSYWTPVLTEAQNRGDPLAYTVVQTLAQFVVLAVNGAVFTRWDLERKKELEDGKEGRPKLTTDDWKHLQRAADAADTAIFIVSTEATVTGNPLREYRWPPAVNGYREALHLDPRITEDFKTALDTMTCIAFVYSLLFLVRMASAGLITCDLVTRKADYEAGCDLNTPQPLTKGQKLPRLLELGSAFLTGISPNPDHPARRHALLVEMILRVGLGAATPQAQGAPSPASSGQRRSPVVGSATVNSQHPQASPPVSAAMPKASSSLAQTSAPMPSPFSLPAQANTSLPPVLPTPPQALQAQSSPQHLVPPQQPPRPVSSFDSWLWDTSTPTSTSFSGPLRMQDGSFVMPDLTVSTSAANAASSLAATASPALASATVPPPSGYMGRQGTSPMQATMTAASAGRRGDAAQAMASLLSEVNPFLDDFYASQPGIGSHAFNDDFGLGPGSLGGPSNSAATGGADVNALNGLDWSSYGASGFGGATPGAGGAEWGFGTGA
ncbi:hypothetical protein JCM10049v2_006054 [Rhodotorula toruloides]